MSLDMANLPGRNSIPEVLRAVQTRLDEVMTAGNVLDSPEGQRIDWCWCVGGRRDTESEGHEDQERGSREHLRRRRATKNGATRLEGRAREYLNREARKTSHEGCMQRDDGPIQLR